MKDLELAMAELKKGVTCAVARGGELLHSNSGLGVKPLLSVYDGARGDLDGASVADTVIGKAAALLLVLGRVKAAYGVVMSESADRLLTASGVEHSFGELAPAIINRTGDGVCPLEMSVSGVDDPDEALSALRRRIAELMAGK